MSDNPTPTPADVAPKPPAQDAPKDTPNPEPKDDAAPDVDWKAEARKWEQRAKENKAAAERLTELEQSQMSESEKVAKRLAEAESEVAAVPAKVTDALRSHLVELHQIGNDDAELFLTATSPDLLLKQVSRLVETKGAGRKHVVPREGTNPRPGGGSSSWGEVLGELDRQRQA